VAPAAVRVTTDPLQMLVVDELTVTVGEGFTVMVIVFVSVQLLVMPYATYDVLVAGDTVIMLPDAEVLHAITLAPVAFSVAVFPLQIVLDEAVRTRVGFCVTVMLCDIVPVQVLLTAETIYTVLADGVAVSVADVEPVLQE
jgi:hypothetical protein